MITLLITFLIAILIALVVFWAVGLFITDARIHKVIGVILGLIVLLYGLKLFYPYLP